MTKRGKDTTVKRRLPRSSSVDASISCSPYSGTMSAHIETAREKAGGGVETIVLDFDELSIYEVACIGRSAVRALRAKRKVDDHENVGRIEYATGWNEGDGPEGAS